MSQTFVYYTIGIEFGVSCVLPMWKYGCYIRFKVIGESINGDKLVELDPVIQTKIIYSILERIYGDDLLIVNDAHVELLFSLIRSNKFFKPSSSI